MQLQTVRKAIAAGAGILLTGLLEYATTSADVERALDAVVPAGLVPLVPVVIGGAATVLAVYRASNTPTSSVPVTVDEPATPTSMPVGPVSMTAAAAATPPATTATAAAVPVSVDPAPFWTGVPSGEPLAVTSMVELVPLPVRSYE